MATYTNYKGGRVRVQIYVNGVRDSKICENKTEAKAWALAREHQVREKGNPAKLTFRELVQAWIERYPNRPGIDWETKRLNVLMRGKLGDFTLKELSKVVVADWRDERLAEVKPGTVLREWTLLSSVCSDAVKEMGLLTENPFYGAKRPEDPPPRDRVATEKEMEQLEHFALLRPAGGVCLQMFKFAIETGMSIGEICALSWDQVNGRVIKLPEFKTRPVREVPLSTKAWAILEKRKEAEPTIFGMTPQRADVNWRKLCSAAGVYDLHFHDARHMAASQLSKKIDALALAKMLGHRDLKMLLNVYYKADAASLVDKLG